MFRNENALIRAYFESHGKLSCAAGLTITGMPASDNSSTWEHLQAKHGDLVLALRDLTERQMLVLSLRYAAAGGCKTYTRYVRSPDEIQSHETLTGNAHPTEAGLTEVTGVFVLGADDRRIAREVGISQDQVRIALAAARRSIRDAARHMGIME